MVPHVMWMSLLTALTLGSNATAVRAEVRAYDVPEAAQLRLVVQTQDKIARKPLGSIQRAVTAAELRKGVHVDVPSIGSSKPLVVAWVERGDANLEYDGLVARPRRRSFVGTASGDDVSIELSRRS